MTEGELWELADRVLTETQKRRLRLRYWEGFSASQIATLERVSVQAVRSCLADAVRVLRNARDEQEAA